MKPLRGNYQLGWSRCNTRRTQNDQDLTPSRTEAGLDASDNIHVSVERREKFFFLTSPLIGQLNSAEWPQFCDHSVTSADVRLSVGVERFRIAGQIKKLEEIGPLSSGNSRSGRRTLHTAVCKGSVFLCSSEGLVLGIGIVTNICVPELPDSIFIVPSN